MLKILLFMVLVGCISMGGGWMLENDGVVSFEWLGYLISTRVSVFFFALVVLIISLLVTIKIISFIIHLPSFLRKKRDNYKLQNNLVTIQVGYAALISGDIDLAKKSSQKLLGSHSNNKIITNLGEMLAAKVAAEEGNLQLAQGYFDKFMEDKKQHYFVVKSSLDAAFKAGDVEKATELAEQAYKIKPNVRNGAHSILELYKKTQKFEQAEEFLKNYQRKHRFFKDRYNAIDTDKEFAHIWLSKAKQILGNFDNDKPDFALAEIYLKKILQKDPNNIEALKLLLKSCKNISDEPTARRFVERAWEQSASYELGAVYMDIINGKNQKQTVKKRLQAIERLRKIGGHSDLLEKLKDKTYDVTIG